MQIFCKKRGRWEFVVLSALFLFVDDKAIPPPFRSHAFQSNPATANKTGQTT